MFHPISEARAVEMQSIASMEAGNQHQTHPEKDQSEGLLLEMESSTIGGRIQYPRSRFLVLDCNLMTTFAEAIQFEQIGS